MTDDQRELLQEARDSVSAARVLLDAGYPGYAASRAYYAMFYVAEALLEGEGMAFSKHSAVIAAFGRHFARTGKVPVEFHRYLIEASELRHAGDYGPPRLSHCRSGRRTDRPCRAVPPTRRERGYLIGLDTHLPGMPITITVGR